MKKLRLPKADQQRAEKAIEWCLIHALRCNETHRVHRPPKYCPHDIFGSDVIGRCTADGVLYYAQVTTGSGDAVSARRRKLERFRWINFERPLVAQLDRIKDGRRYRYWFNTWIWLPVSRAWSETELPCEREWLDNAVRKHDGHIVSKTR